MGLMLRRRTKPRNARTQSALHVRVRVSRYTVNGSCFACVLLLLMPVSSPKTHFGPILAWGLCPPLFVFPPLRARDFFSLGNTEKVSLISVRNLNAASSSRIKAAGAVQWSVSHVYNCSTLHTWTIAKWGRCFFWAQEVRFFKFSKANIPTLKF